MGRRIASYLLAVAAVAAAVLLRWLLDPIMHGTLPVATLFGAVIVAVYFGGVGPAVAATLLGYVAANYLFIEPVNGFALDTAETLTGFIVYLMTCAVIIGMGEAARISRGRFEELAAQASGSPPAIGNIEAIRRHHGLRDLAVGGFVLTLAVLIMGGIIGYRNVHRLVVNDRWVSHTHEVIGDLETLKATLTEAETARRAVVVARDLKSLQPYADALARVQTAIVPLHAMTADNPAQRARLAGIERETVAHTRALERVTALAQRGDRPGAIALLANGGGAARLDTLRARTVTMIDVEEGLLRERALESDASASTAILWIALATGIGALLICGVFYLTQRNARIRSEAAATVERELKEADRRKDEFLATLAHELRGPLAPLGNVIALLQRTEREDGPMRQIRGTIERQVRQLVRLVDDLLDVSRITRGRLELRRERVELGSILRQALETCRPLVDERQQQITVTLADDPIYLDADRARLAQVFYNLLNNAAKYTPPGGYIWLLAERRDAEVVVRVRDNGRGIEPDKLERIFEPFTQGDSTLERASGGLGIGLSLAKQLVAMHGGSISAASEGVGKGTELTVRLPLGLQTPPTPPAIPPGRQRTRSSARRVLVVDDNRDSADTLASLLRMSGNETHLAHDGEEAVGAAEKLRPDVVVLDIGLPKLNGYDACRRIRAQPWGRKMIMVALTGWGQQQDRRQAQEAGFDHHMVKPVDYEALARVVSRVNSPA